MSSGRSGFVMANSASDARGSELEIRKQLIQDRAVDVMIAIGPNFFYTVTLPCTLWFLDRGKRDSERADKVLFIDARQIFHQIDRAHREFTPDQIEFIANIVRLYRGEAVETVKCSSERMAETFPEGIYRDVAGLCKVATLEEIEAQGWSLNPGRYVGVAERPPDEFDFYERLEELNEELELLNAEAHELEEKIAENVESNVGDGETMTGLMVERRLVRLEEVCREITVGHVGPMARRLRRRGHPFSPVTEHPTVQTGSFQPEAHAHRDFHRKLRKSALSPGDVVVVRTGYPGTACVDS